MLVLYSMLCRFLKTNISNYIKYSFLPMYLNVMFGDIFTSNSYIISSSVTLNVNLLNGLMLIHPPILYVFYVFYVLEFKVNTFLKYRKVVKGVLIRYKTVYLSILIYFSIILGCWWAEQELSWGGW